jgi:DNA-binding transcriptional LysR family regulator
MLDVRRLELIHRFALLGTLAAVADSMHLTAPAVSQQLASLQRETRTVLVEKAGRRLCLTPVGRRLAEHAEVVLSQLAAAEADLAVAADGRLGDVRIAACATAIESLLPGVWHALAADNLAITLHVTELNAEDAAGAVRRHEVDIALSHAYSVMPHGVPHGCEQQALLSEPVMLVVPARDGVSEPAAVCDLRRFATADWVVAIEGTACRELVRRACGNAGFVPRVIAQVNDFAAVAALVRAGVGVSLLPQTGLPVNRVGISVHPLRRPLQRHVSVITRVGTSFRPDLRAVVDALHRRASELDHGEGSPNRMVAAGR